MELDRDDLLSLYYFMRLTRGVEERVRKLYLQGKIVGGVYCSDGHEGITVGSAFALRKEDIMAPLHRDMGAQLVRGLTPRQVFAQYLGRRTGPTRGRDGNVHTGDLKVGTIAMASMLGTSIPIAAGAALSFKIRGQARVAMTYIGDGGSNTGDFHEGLNFAAVLGLPVVLIIENNQFAYSTPLRRSVAVPDLAVRAQSYGIPGVVVDGNDVLAVYEATKAAVDRARGGGGPTLIEAKTMRVRGHSEHDDATYVPKELRDLWLRKDPILRFTAYLRERGVLDDSLEGEVKRRVDREIEAAVEFADKSPFPDPEELTEGVFKESLPKVRLRATRMAKL
ncbi:MAG: thiamine pyrophosphate-dependent dehydrogenase E1 component subunit alpha [Chloroflexota bacterium]